MLEALVGNKTVQKILLFLYVNGKGYGSQLQRYLKTPLTPIQKALLRLEKGGIVKSDFEGKTRVYTFNASWPIFPELEWLLKKTYTLLPSDERKKYCCFDKRETLFSLWKQLEKISQVSFDARTHKGKGDVQVSKEAEHILIFNEKGSWKNKEGDQINFTNVFRWTLDLSTETIALEHLRRGWNHPVFLFHLTLTAKDCLSPVQAHHCAADVYFGEVVFDHKKIRLSWRILGPKKNEEIDYFYSCQKDVKNINS